MNKHFIHFPLTLPFRAGSARSAGVGSKSLALYLVNNMTTATRKRKIFRRIIIILSRAGVIVLLSISLVSADWQWNRTVATVTNESTQTVDNVELHKSSGGLYTLGRIEPGQPKSVQINPHENAGLQASFSTGAEDKKRVAWVTDVEASGGYRPKLTVDKSGKAQWGYEKNFMWPLRP